MVKDKYLDLLAGSQLSPLMQRSGIYLPFTNSSLRLASLSVLLNDIIINQRKFIVELGSGLTTFLIGQLICQNNLKDVKLLSIEENKDWFEFMKQMIITLDISENISLINAPLVANEYSKNLLKWYNTEIITKKLQEINRKIDCVLVDGPSAWNKEIEMSRFPALPYFINHMSENSIVFLDDSNRNGERKIIEEWKSFNLTATEHNQSFLSFHKGHFFNISI